MTGERKRKLDGKPDIVFVYTLRSFEFCSGIHQEQLYKRERLFRETLDRCDSVVQKQLGWSILEKFYKARKGQVAEEYFEPALTARQIAFTELLRSQGVMPAAVVGFSAGEFAAGYAASVLSLESAMDLTCRFVRNMLKGIGLGKGLIAYISPERAEDLLKSSSKPFHVAAHLSSNHVFLCCETECFEGLRAFLTERKIAYDVTDTNFGYHSPITDCWKDEFINAGVINHSRSGEPAFYSATTGSRLDQRVFDSFHWWSAVRKPLLGLETFRSLFTDGYDTFFQIGYSPFTSLTIQELAAVHRKTATLLNCTSNNSKAGKVFDQSVHTLESLGYPVLRRRSSIRSFLGSHFLFKRPDRGKIIADPFSQQVRANPYPNYRLLRDSSPVHYFKDRGFWAVSRYKDVMDVLKRPDVFSSLRGGPTVNPIIDQDPPDHTRIRKAVTEFFSDASVAALDQRMHDYTNRQIEKIIEKVDFDLVADLAAPVPQAIVFEFLGLSPEGLKNVERWIEAWGVLLSGNQHEKEHAAPTVQEFHDFFVAQVHNCKKQEGTGLLHGLFHGSSIEPQITIGEAVAVAKFLMLAGTVTTTNLLGNAVLALLRHPTEMKRVMENIKLVPALVEESLRYDSPAQKLGRTATKDVEISGVRIPAGGELQLLLGSANRDERQFPDPDRFSIERNPQGHVAFGAGIHFCLGARLSRWESRIILESLLSKLPELRAAQDLDHLEYLRIPIVRGLKRLNLTFGKN